MRVLLFFLLLAIVTVYAFFRGGRDERLAVAICLAATVGSLAVMLPEDVDYRDLQPLVALIDVAVLGAFTWIALRSERFWPLWIAGLQLTSTTGHLLKLLKPDMVSLAYSASLALWSYAILLILAVGTWRASKRGQAMKQISAA
jgi:hypothetical protein